MSILSFLLGRSRRGVPVNAPTIPLVSAIPPQENYDKAYGHPPMSLFTGGYIPNPFRMHAPFPVERDKDRLVTNTGITTFAYDPSIQRVTDNSLQQYFNQKSTLPSQDVAVPAHGVFVQKTLRDCVDHDKYSGFVPPDTRGDVKPSHSPTVLLSTPINVTTNQVANPDLLASNVSSPPLKIVSYDNRKVPRVIGHGK
jgi:hypothetical protein